MSRPILYTSSTCPNCKPIKAMIDQQMPYGAVEERNTSVVRGATEELEAMGIRAVPTLIMNGRSFSGVAMIKQALGLR